MHANWRVRFLSQREQIRKASPGRLLSRMRNPTPTNCRVNQQSDSVDSETPIECPHLPINCVSRRAQCASNCFGGLTVCDADKNFLSQGGKVRLLSVMCERACTNKTIRHKRKDILVHQTT